jgi:4-amino-4-deoxy-L-arabinose transferase-like glycosyltransferase
MNDTPRRAPFGHRLLLAVVCLPLFVVGLGDYGLVNGDEAVYHHIARDMAHSGDWLRLDSAGRFSPADEFRNAPLHYWLRVGLIVLLGDNYWSMRALSALAAIASVFVVHATGLMLAGPAAALAGALVHATTFGFVYIHSARTGELDAIVVALVAASCHLFLRRVLHGGSWLAHHAVLVLLANTKLPLLAIPLGAEVAVMALWPRARIHFVSWLGWGLAAAPFGLGWHLARLAVLGEHRAGLLLELQAGASGTAVTGSDAAPRLAWRVLYYGRITLFSTFPWTLAYAPALAWVRQRGAAWMALLAWPAAAVVMFAAIGRTNPWYLHPAWPALSVVTGAWLAHQWRDAPRPGPALVTAATATALGLASATLWFGLNPFAETGKRLGYLIAAGLDPSRVVGALAVGAVAGAVAAVVSNRFRPALGARTALVLVSVLAALRVALPLGHLDYVSPTEQTARQLAAARASGAPESLPRDLTEESWKKVSFLFADHYALCRPPGRLGAQRQFVVGPKANPAFCHDIGGRLMGGMPTYRVLPSRTAR